MTKNINHLILGLGWGSFLEQTYESRSSNWKIYRWKLRLTTVKDVITFNNFSSNFYAKPFFELIFPEKLPQHRVWFRSKICTLCTQKFVCTVIFFSLIAQSGTSVSQQLSRRWPMQRNLAEKWWNGTMSKNTHQSS